MNVPLQWVRFCSIECDLQNSRPRSVSWMVDSWIYARSIANTRNNMYDGYAYTLPTISDVLNLGKLVEPNENVKGFRTCGVQIGLEVKMNWQDIPRQMNNLMDAVKEGAFESRSLGKGISSSRNSGANEFFKEYEEIHPFRDGNGRTGQILFNWLNGTLDHPVWAKNFFNDARRTVGFGA